jgi:hypothetical protein
MTKVIQKDNSFDDQHVSTASASSSPFTEASCTNFKISSPAESAHSSDATANTFANPFALKLE